MKDGNNHFRGVSGGYIRISGKLALVTLHCQEQFQQSAISFCSNISWRKNWQCSVAQFALEETFVDREDMLLWALLVHDLPARDMAYYLGLNSLCQA